MGFPKAKVKDGNSGNSRSSSNPPFSSHTVFITQSKIQVQVQVQIQIQKHPLSLSLLLFSSLLLSTLSSTHHKQKRHGHTQQQNPFHQNRIDIGATRFDAYNRLQAVDFAFVENLPIPEIVAFGKRSLLEALLGFRFNVREVEMGTRRLLIFQMVHDPTALEPGVGFSEHPEVVAKMASGVGVQPLYPIVISLSLSILGLKLVDKQIGDVLNAKIYSTVKFRRGVRF